MTDIPLFKAQRQTLVELAMSGKLSSGEQEALDGINNLLDSIYDELVPAEEECRHAHTIIFNNKEHLLRLIDLPDIGSVFIGTLDLEAELLKEDGSGGFVSDEAEEVDQQIYYYVEEDQIDLSDEELLKLVHSI